MKNTNITLYARVTLLSFCAAVLFLSCDKSSTQYPLPEKTNNKRPEGVQVTAVENIAGGAIIHYSLPSEKNLLYVKAVYTTGNGTKKSTSKQSYFKKQIKVDGFVDTKSYKVKLYTYLRGKKGVHSKPVEVNIQPQVAPFKLVYRSINVKNTFGGATISYQNTDTASVSIVFLADTTGNGVFTIVHREFTKYKEGTFSIRGLKPKKTNIRYFVRGPHNNYTDTAKTSIKPYAEVKADKSKWKLANFPSDVDPDKVYSGSYKLPNLWDGKSTRFGHDFYQGKGFKLPIWFTINLGGTYQISRFLMGGRPHYGYFTGPWPRKVEVWGSKDPNIKDGIPFDDSWERLGAFTIKVPKGYDGVTQDLIDKKYPANNINFNIPDSQSKQGVQYLRFKFNETWGGITTEVEFGEITVFGADLSKESN